MAEQSPEDDKAKVVIEYRFPGVVNDCTDIRASFNYTPVVRIWNVPPVTRRAVAALVLSGKQSCYLLIITLELAG